MLRPGVQHRRVGPAGGPFFGHNAGNRLAGGLQQVHLERPGAGGGHTLVGEVIDLDEGIMPVAADELPLAA